jgi:hypothetical protein
MEPKAKVKNRVCVGRYVGPHASPARIVVCAPTTPIGVPEIDLINPANTSSLFVDPAIFSNPADGQLGDSPVSFDNWRTWGYNDEDASLLKRFGFGNNERYGLTLRAEFFNVFNRHYWAGPNLTMGSAYFGHVTDTTGSPRQGQLGARFEW